MVREVICMLIIMTLVQGCARNGAELRRPGEWAAPVALAGVGRLYRVTDNLYRSEEPTAEGMRNLEKMGIRTIINLRVLHSDAGRIKGTGIRIENLSVKPWHVEDEDVVRVLRIIRHKDDGPFLIHCGSGSDRAGFMVAMFRIVEQGWTKEEAIREMVAGGYGFNRLWVNMVRYLEQVDIEKIRKEVAR